MPLRSLRAGAGSSARDSTSARMEATRARCASSRSVPFLSPAASRRSANRSDNEGDADADADAGGPRRWERAPRGDGLAIPRRSEGPGRRQRAIDARDADGATTKAHIAERTCRDAPTRVPRGGSKRQLSKRTACWSFGRTTYPSSSSGRCAPDVRVYDGLDFISRIRDNHDEWAPQDTLSCPPPPALPFVDRALVAHNLLLALSLPSFPVPSSNVPLAAAVAAPPRAASEARRLVAPVRDVVVGRADAPKVHVVYELTARLRRVPRWPRWRPRGWSPYATPTYPPTRSFRWRRIDDGCGPERVSRDARVGALRRRAKRYHRRPHLLM